MRRVTKLLVVSLVFLSLVQSSYVVATKYVLVETKKQVELLLVIEKLRTNYVDEVRNMYEDRIRLGEAYRLTLLQLMNNLGIDKLPSSSVASILLAKYEETLGPAKVISSN